MADTTIKTEPQNLNGATVATIAIEDLYNKDKFDMSTMETDNIFQLLKTSEAGLTTAEAEARVAKVTIQFDLISSSVLFTCVNVCLLAHRSCTDNAGKLCISWFGTLAKKKKKLFSATSCNMVR
jgi:hypothetical protein